jgi:hypothetical protein
MLGPIPVGLRQVCAYTKPSFRVQTDRYQAILGAVTLQARTVRPAAPRTPRDVERVEKRELEAPKPEPAMVRGNWAKASNAANR